jgi:hypothetical protein
LLQSEEEDSFKNDATQTAQCKQRRKEFQILRKEGSESQDSWKEEHQCKKGESDLAVFSGIDSFQGRPGSLAQVI